MTETNRAVDGGVHRNRMKWLEDNPREAGQFLLEQKIRDFGEEVSVVGMRYIIRSSVNSFRKLIWITLVLLGIGFMIYQFQDRIDYYLSRPTSADYRITYNDSIVFPTVTICNENMALEKNADALDMTELISVLFPPPVPGNITIDFDSINLVFDNVDWLDIYEKLKQPTKEAILSCTWQGAECDHTWFKEAFTEMGSCFQFNPDKTMRSSRPGAANGLKLMLFVDQENYLGVTSLSAGFRVLLHTPEEPALMEEWAFKVNPGAHTLVGVTNKMIKQLPEPYGICSDTRGANFKDCISRCRGDFTDARCGCKAIAFALEGDLPICDPIQFAECYMPVVIEYITTGAQEKCGCSPQCERIVYDYVLSSSDISKFVLNYMAENSFPGVPVESIREDILVLDIFYPDIAIEETITKIGYTFLALLCDVGGAMGLILGSTLLTVFEITDFAFVTLWDTIFYAKARHTQKRISVKPMRT